MSLTAVAMSDWMEAQWLNWFQGTTFPAAPTTLYFGLFTTNPADAGTSASPQDGTEVTTSNGTLGFSNYARIAMTASTGWTSITAATGDTTGQQEQNAAALTGTGWTNNGGSSVTITGVGCWSASTGGHLYCYFPLTASQPLANGSAFSIASDGLTLQDD